MTVELEGQELRERVARIMGWKVIDGYAVPTSNSNKPIPLPKFDKDPAACKIVKDWLREQGISFEITWWAENEIWEDEPEAYCTASRAGHRFNTLVEAPTEELAVCRFVVALDDAEDSDE